VAAVLTVAAVVLVRNLGDDPVDQAVPGPVIVVPGYGGDASDLDPLVERLRRDGRTVVAFEPTQGGTGDLRVQARRLADLATRTIDRTDSGSVDVVGYSAGGVIARLFVRDEGGASVVRRVLTLGSPHHGTEVAAIAQDVAGGCPTACEQLATGSDLLRRLNAGDETPAGPRWITVRTDADRTVTPSTSAELDGALNIDVQDVCDGSTTSHGELPGDPVVVATVRSALGAGAPRVPTSVTC
jgi:triacylglycerol lipase